MRMTYRHRLWARRRISKCMSVQRGWRKARISTGFWGRMKELRGVRRVTKTSQRRTHNFTRVGSRLDIPSPVTRHAVYLCSVELRHPKVSWLGALVIGKLTRQTSRFHTLPGSGGLEPIRPEAGNRSPYKGDSTICPRDVSRQRPLSPDTQHTVYDSHAMRRCAYKRSLAWSIGHTPSTTSSLPDPSPSILTKGERARAHPIG